MVICAVLGCSKRTDRDREFSFFRFPAVKEKCSTFLKELQKDRRNLWIQRINRKNFTDVQARYARVCSSHFIAGKPCDIKDRNNPDWAPSLNLGHQKVKDIDGTVARYERLKKFLKCVTYNLQADQIMELQIPHLLCLTFREKVHDEHVAHVGNLCDIWKGHKLGPPIVVHCSAGIDRTGI